MLEQRLQVVPSFERALCRHWVTHLYVAFQKFLMEFSVRPGRRRAILDQWLPTRQWHTARMNSSSAVQWPLRAGGGGRRGVRRHRPHGGLRVKCDAPAPATWRRSAMTNPHPRPARCPSPPHRTRSLSPSSLTDEVLGPWRGTHLTIPSLKWLSHRSRHCLPVRPGMCCTGASEGAVPPGSGNWHAGCRQPARGEAALGAHLPAGAARRPHRPAAAARQPSMHHRRTWEIVLQLRSVPYFLISCWSSLCSSAVHRQCLRAASSPRAGHAGVPGAGCCQLLAGGSRVPLRLHASPKPGPHLPCPRCTCALTAVNGAGCAAAMAGGVCSGRVASAAPPPPPVQGAGLLAAARAAAGGALAARGGRHLAGVAAVLILGGILHVQVLVVLLLAELLQGLQRRRAHAHHGHGGARGRWGVRGHEVLVAPRGPSGLQARQVCKMGWRQRFPWLRRPWAAVAARVQGECRLQVSLAHQLAEAAR